MTSAVVQNVCEKLIFRIEYYHVVKPGVCCPFIGTLETFANTTGSVYNNNNSPIMTHGVRPSPPQYNNVLIRRSSAGPYFIWLSNLPNPIGTTRTPSRPARTIAQRQKGSLWHFEFIRKSTSLSNAYHNHNCLSRKNVMAHLPCASPITHHTSVAHQKLTGFFERLCLKRPPSILNV